MQTLRAARAIGAALLLALAVPAHAGNIGQAPIGGLGLVDGNWLLGLAGGGNQTYQNGITAHAGGGQTAALQLPAGVQFLQVDTVATGGDSVALPVCFAPAAVTLRNNGASSMNVYASTLTNLLTATTDTLNGSTNATAYAMPANSEADFYCIKNGQWAGSASPANATFPASGILVGTTDTQTLSAKTLTAPTINAATLSGTFAGNATFSGNNTYSGTSAFSGVVTPTAGIAAAGGFSASPRLVMTGNWKPLAITDGTEVTCVTTTTYVAEVFVPSNMTVTGVSVVNATAVAGNIQIGLADSTGAPIAAALTASTAASGTAVYQRVPFAVSFAAKGPATYYVQLQCNNTGYKFRAHTVGDFGTQSQTSGTFGTFASFSPAGTFTTVVGPVASFY